jgi:hypothetical protein
MVIGKTEAEVGSRVGEDSVVGGTSEPTGASVGGTVTGEHAPSKRGRISKRGNTILRNMKTSNGYIVYVLDVLKKNNNPTFRVGLLVRYKSIYHTLPP